MKKTDDPKVRIYKIDVYPLGKKRYIYALEDLW